MNLVFLDSAHKWYLTELIFLGLTYPCSLMPSSSICIVANGRISFFLNMVFQDNRYAIFHCIVYLPIFYLSVIYLNSLDVLQQVNAKQNVVLLYHEILLNRKKTQTTETCNNLDQSPENYAEQRKPVQNCYML